MTETATLPYCTDPKHRIHGPCREGTCERCGKKSCWYIDGPYSFMPPNLYSAMYDCVELCQDCINEAYATWAKFMGEKKLKVWIS